MSFMLTAWLPKLSVNLTSSLGWCECILNSLSLSKACTLSLHQDKLSKMEDEQALAGKETGNATFGEHARDHNLSGVFECCAKCEKIPSVCVFYIVKIISIEEVLWCDCLKDSLHTWSVHRNNPYSGSSFPCLNFLPCTGIENDVPSWGSPNVYVVNQQASCKKLKLKPKVLTHEWGVNVLCIGHRIETD